MVGLGSGAGAVLAFGLGPLAAAPPAHADEFDVIIDPIINSLIGWRVRRHRRHRQPRQLRPAAAGRPPRSSRPLRAQRPWSVEVDGRRVGVAVCG